MRGKNLKYFVLGFALAAVGLWAAAVGNLSTFQAGTPIKAGEVNQNFAVLKEGIAALETGKQATLSGSPCAAGQFVQGIAADGAVTCGIDQIGPGGSAGVSSLNGKSGSLTFQAGNNISLDNSQAGRIIISASGSLALPFNATTSSAGTAFLVINSGTGPAIQGSSPNASGDGLSGISLRGAAVKAYSESGYGLDARSGSGSTIRVQSSSTTCAVCIFQGDGGDIISGAGPTVRNGYNFRVTSDATVLARAFNVASDRNLKANFKRVDVSKVLEQVVRLPITRWNYKEDAANIAHLGPMAQDFHAAFGLNGSDNKRISTVDAQGVALAAVQGLNQKLEQKVTQLEAENADLRADLTALEARLSKLEQR